MAEFLASGEFLLLAIMFTQTATLAVCFYMLTRNRRRVAELEKALALAAGWNGDYTLWYECPFVSGSWDDCPHPDEATFCELGGAEDCRRWKSLEKAVLCWCEYYIEQARAALADGEEKEG